MRYYVNNSSWFDTHKYDKISMKKVIKNNGGKNIRTANKFGWSNLPSVVTFNATPKLKTKIEKALEKAFGTSWIHIIVKEW